MLGFEKHTEVEKYIEASKLKKQERIFMVCSLFIGIEVCLDSSVPTCFQYGVLSVVKYSFTRNKTLVLCVK